MPQLEIYRHAYTKTTIAAMGISYIYSMQITEALLSQRGFTRRQYERTIYWTLSGATIFQNAAGFYTFAREKGETPIGTMGEVENYLVEHSTVYRPQFS